LQADLSGGILFWKVEKKQKFRQPLMAMDPTDASIEILYDGLTIGGALIYDGQQSPRTLDW
jgi:hypothetical protein